jgi:parallel beta-helix repeat protein
MVFNCIDEPRAPSRLADVTPMLISKVNHNENCYTSGRPPRKELGCGCRWLPAALAGVFASLTLAAGLDCFVAPGGNDQAAGTLVAPFRTINRAMAAVTAGSTIYLRAGLYVEDLRVDPWEVSGYTLAAHAGEPVTISPPAGNIALTLSTVNGFTARGLRFLNGGVNVQFNAQNVALRDCIIESAQGDFAIRLDATRNVEINGCRFTGNRAPAIVSVTGVNENLRIENNTFEDNHGSQGELQATILLTAQAPTETIRIEGNTFRMTRDKSTRPVISAAASVAAIMLHQCQGASFSQPRLVIRSNTIAGYRFRGSNDDRSYDPAYLKTPEQGGEQGNGISIIESAQVEISGNRISWVSTYGLIGHLSRHLAITGNEFRSCGLNGVFLTGNPASNTGASPNLIAGNRVFDSGWLTGGTSGISTIHPGPGNLILRNFVSGQRNGLAGTVGADWYGDGNGILADLDSNGTFIMGNVVVHNEGAGISVNRSSDTVVAHNTVVGNGHCPHLRDNAGIFIAGEVGPSDRIFVANNLVFNNRARQFWVWKTALDHVVHHNVFAWGALTLPERRDLPIDWYGAYYSVSNWTAYPPRPGNGVGELGEHPVFLGDLVGGNPREDTLYYLPVNASAGAGSAAARAILPAWSPPAGLEGTPMAETALGLGLAAVPRPATLANRGALEPSTAALSTVGGGSVRLRGTPPTGPRVWAEHLVTWLEWRDGGVYSPENDRDRRLGHQRILRLHLARGRRRGE